MNILPQLKAQVFVLSARVAQSKASQLCLSWLHLLGYISPKLHEYELGKKMASCISRIRKYRVKPS